MKPEHQQRLEREIDSALKSLPDRQAPEHLLSRVITRIETATATPWYHRSWSDWPAPAKWTTFLVLASVFTGVCLVWSSALQVQTLQPFLARLQSLANLADALWSVLGALAGLLTATLRHLNTWVLVGCAAMVLLGYVLCVGLGTVYFRVALARR